jgi:acetylornithine deacetylase
MSRVVDILQSLIRLPSVNPDGAPDSPHAGEAQVAHWTADFLRHIGAEVELEEVLPGRPNVIGHFASGGPPKPRVLLAPHTDTVDVESMTIDPFAAEIRDGRVYGRGACDTKGTMAAMLAALEEMGADRLAGLGNAVTFAGLIGEETGQYGSRHLARHHGSEYAFALVGEPTSCGVVHTHKGCSWLTLETTGLACHGSTPERGRSAILEMVPVIIALSAGLRARFQSGEFDHPVLGSPTLNIGTIHGGTRPNIVPARCTIELDIRETPALHRHGVRRVLDEWVEAAKLGGKVTIHGASSCAPLDTSPDNPYVRTLASLGAPLVGAPWFCDAAWLAEEGGIPSVAAGPGSIAQAHTADEFIEIQDLEEGVRFYRRFLESL